MINENGLVVRNASISKYMFRLVLNYEQLEN